MDTNKLFKISLVFLLGFISASSLGYFLVYGLEIPLSLSLNNNSNNAPFDFIKEDNIMIYDDKIVISIDGASLSRYAPTGSMIPVLDEGSNGIRIQPNNPEDVHIGDIITFQKNQSLIVHRVIDKGTDEQGDYFITKGDNNTFSDGKIRFKDVKYITIGIIW